MKLFRTLTLAATVLAPVGHAQAFFIPFAGTIDAATVNSGIGTYTPVFDANVFSGVVATNASNQFYVTLHLPHFTSDGPGCADPASGCGVFSSSGSFTVTDDGSSTSGHSFSQSGNIVTFSVFNVPGGSIIGTLDLGALTGDISTDLYAGQAFRADNAAFLEAQLTVNAVPLPAAAPLFGAALLMLGAVGSRFRRGTTAT